MKPARQLARGSAALLLVALVTTLAALLAWQLHAKLQTEHQVMHAPTATDDAWEWTRSALAWTLAQMNSVRRPNPGCVSDDPQLRRFREAYVGDDGTTRRAYCTAAWPLTCHCPELDNSTPSVPPGTKAIEISIQAQTATPAASPQWEINVRHGSRHLSALVMRHALLHDLHGLPICAAEAAVFRQPLAQWAALPQVRRLTCPPDRPCDADLAAAVAAGWRLFHFPEGLTLIGLPGGTTLGSPEAPLLLAVQGPQQWPAGSILHGFLWAAAGDDAASLGHLTVHGTALTCETTPAAVWPSAEVWNQLQAEAVWFALIPGSWTDQP